MRRIFRILQQYLEKNKEISLAFLFGSFAKRTQKKESDLDIAVYFKNYKFQPFRKKPKKIKELERKVWFELTKLTHKEIDLVCLNQASATSISDIIKTGIPLSIKDEKLFGSFI
jgi:predicted nucleotidyltransferase